METKRKLPHRGSQTQFILCTGALLGNPVMIAHSAKRRLVVPVAVRMELGTRLRGSGSADVLKVISSAKQIDFAPNLLGGLPGGEVWNLKGTDAEVAKIAIDRAQNVGAGNVVVVTQNAELRNFLAGYGIEALTSRGALQEWSNDSLDRDMQASVKSYSDKQWQSVILSVLGGISITTLMAFAFRHSAEIIAALSSIGAVILLGIVGVLLYWFRQKYRLPYGAAEWFFGLLITKDAVYSPTSTDFVLQGIQILGGLYVMVRGLDNLGKGFQGTYFEAKWESFFKEAH